jgi:putative mRNA 3-end processing factor
LPLIRRTDRGLYCEAGDFHIDPWAPVETAVVTHAHGDHVAWDCGGYLTAAPGRRLLAARTNGGPVQGLAYGEVLTRRGVRLSLHPAGHILGSAQIRVEHGGEIWVVSGDYKTEPDPTCAAFAPVRCHTFVTESTFGLPIYRWEPEPGLRAAVNAWWRANADAGRPSLLFGYALGKAQRLLAGLDPSIGPILAHGAVERMAELYRAEGVTLPATLPARAADRPADIARAVVLAPPSARATAWSRRFGDAATGYASGWMRVRGARRRRGIDRGFVLSDHADWPGLLSAIDATGAGCVWVTHGYAAPLVQWLGEHGLEAKSVETRYGGEQEESPDEAAEEQA